MRGMTPHVRLRQARESRHYKSAAQAAEAMGVPYGTYSGHENGGRGIKRDDILKYATFFRVSPGWLDYGEGEMEIILPPEAYSALKGLKGDYLRKAAELILIVKGLQDAGKSLPEISNPIDNHDELTPELSGRRIQRSFS